MIQTDFSGAVIIGLLGAGHCIGMCGGVASAMSMGIPQGKSKWPYLVLYNLGRIITYVAAGAVIGGSLSSLLEVAGIGQGFLWLRLAVAIMMILLALYIARLWNGLSYVERAGARIWRHIAPYASKLLPLSSPLSAIPFGFIWGWLPCGLVYSALSWSAVSGSSLSGGMIMLGFGLGTLPAMLLIGSTAETVKNALNNMIFRRLSSLILLMYGLVTAYHVINQFH